MAKEYVKAAYCPPAKFNIQRMLIIASGPNTSWQIDGETVETVIDFIF